MSKTFSTNIGSSINGGNESKSVNRLVDSVIEIKVTVPAGTANMLIWSGSQLVTKVKAFYAEMQFASVTDQTANVVLEYNSNAATGDATQNWKPNSNYAWNDQCGQPTPMPASLGSNIMTAIYATNPDASNDLTAILRFGIIL